MRTQYSTDLLSYLKIWTAVEGQNLFTDNTGGRSKSALPHMARMVSLLGPPPQSLLEKSEKTKHFFDKHGMCSVLAIHSLLIEISNVKIRTQG